MMVYFKKLSDARKYAEKNRPDGVIRYDVERAMYYISVF